MFNFGLFNKILEVCEVPANQANATMRDIATAINYKFETMFLMYLADKVDDQQMEHFVDLVNIADLDTMDTMQKYQQWVKNNPDVDMTEFMEKLEDELSDMQVRLIQSLSGNLTRPQKIKLLDFLQDQDMEIDMQVEEFVKSEL